MKLLTQGEITVNHIQVVRDNKDLKIWEAGLHAKHAKIAGGDYDGSMKVHFYRDRDTMHVNQDLPGSTIFDTGLNHKDWNIMLDVSGYNALIFAWRKPARRGKRVYEFEGNPCELSDECDVNDND